MVVTSSYKCWFIKASCTLFLFQVAGGQWFLSSDDNHLKGDIGAADRCFCQLKGTIDDCSCSVELVDKFNNLKIFPRLRSLLQKDFFRYWKINLNKRCPFWADDSKCAMRYCNVKPCTEVPASYKGSESNANSKGSKRKKSHMEEDHCDDGNDLGSLNTTISRESQEGFQRWAAYDDAQDNFCEFNDDSVGSQYVDLLLNPERFTGYVGPSAHRVWRSIYLENCFKPSKVKKTSTPFTDLSGMGEMCLEKRTFYRAISGLHSSINIHLASNYLLSDRDGFEESKEGVWGPNFSEFQNRFDPSLTDGEGPLRLQNLYFLYLLELRALAKAAPYLENFDFFTGSDEEDADVQVAVVDLIKIIRNFPEHFNEAGLFTGDKAVEMKEQFRVHFRNISRIMDCVGCDKCRLWGNLQVTGLGTALKILFSGNFDHPPSIKSQNLFVQESKFQLTRAEIVALFNAFGRLSNSVFELESFRKMSLQ